MLHCGIDAAPQPAMRNMFSGDCYITLQFRGQRTFAMKRAPTPRGPRPGSIVRSPDVDYADLDQHFGYALKRAQIASFEAFSRATAGEQFLV